MKKTISSILVGLLVLTLCACSNNGKTNTDSPEQTTTSSNTNTTQVKDELIYNSSDAFDYIEVDGGVSIIEFKNYDCVEYDKIIVPSKLDGKDVIGIGDSDRDYNVFGAVFGECEIELPDSVSYIGDYAFQDSKGLIKLSGAKNCREIGEFAFLNCTNLIEITFLDSVQNIADTAFMDCDNLKQD